MKEKLTVSDLLEQNTGAKSQAAAIEEAARHIGQLRMLGVAPKKYELDGPFGDRAWLRKTGPQIAASRVRSFKLT